MENDNSNPVPSKQPTDTTPASPQAAQTGVYGKKSTWVKWLIIYVIVALVAYGLIYLWWAHGHPSTATGSNASGSLY